MQSVVKLALACSLVAMVVACDRPSQRPPQAPPTGSYAQPYGAPPGAYPQPYGAPPGAYTQPYGAPPGAYTQPYGAPPGAYTQPSPSTPSPAGPATPPPAPTASAPLPPVSADPLNQLDLAFMRQRANGVLTELRSVLPQGQASAVASIPLIVDDTPGEVNAFAACPKQGPVMAVSDGLLEITAQMARAKATDELFGTSKLSDYIKLVSNQQQARQPIVRPAPGFFEPSQDADGRKVARQHALFDEQVAFILGHELAHHYLQHTGCAGAQPAFVTPADIGRLLSNAVPVFNQPNELASDMNGVTNLLQAGKVRSGQHWNEEGALMVLHFFISLMQMDPADRLLFAFQGSHPPPELRIPIVQQAANQWRSTGGAAGAWPLPLPLPLPFP